MQTYLFVHFREKSSPDGEQVHFSVSRDGFRWEALNGGRPVLWAYYGEHGVRDFTITRCPASGKYYIFATDLSLAYGMRNQYHHSWDEIGRHGSKCFAVWESDNLLDWSEQRLIQLGTEDFGCLWAPDFIWDRAAGNYILHWSSSHRANNYGPKKIYYSRTSDFEHFTSPQVLYEKADSGVIDSAVYEEAGRYYLFVKSERNPERIIMLSSEHASGPYQREYGFDASMAALEAGQYEAPTAVRLEDGRWALFLDYYGVPGAGQGYVPFIAEHLRGGHFVRADREFSFPYGFKHGTILSIGMEDYERLRQHRWEN